MPITVKATIYKQASRAPDFIPGLRAGKKGRVASTYSSKPGACAPPSRAATAKGCFGKLFMQNGQPMIQMCSGAQAVGTPFEVQNQRDATKKIARACRLGTDPTTMGSFSGRRPRSASRTTTRIRRWSHR